MRFATKTSTLLTGGALLAALALAAPLSAQTPYNQVPQPYNAQDPQNYGSPAAQSYSGQQQGYPQQQQGYPQQQPMYNNPQQDQQQYPPNPYGNQQQGSGAQPGQEQVYQAPPPLPSYDQPPAPGDGYIWTPGYWAFGPGGYYWVPGAWVAAPYEGALWTPGYWGDNGGAYLWNAGYWGPYVGFYGGINYGFGYFGTGFYGGYWRDHRFFYNREYSRVGIGFRNVYNQRFAGVSSVRPGGASFTSARYSGTQVRGGTYSNQGSAQFRGGVTSQFAGGQHVAPAQTTYGRSGYNQGATSYNQGAANYARPTGQQGFQGTPQRSAAPAANSYHASPSAGAPHVSAPSSSGGGFHGGGGGGGASHGGGGHR